MKGVRSVYRNHRLVRILLSPLVGVRQFLGINQAAKEAVRDRHQDVIIENLKGILSEDPVMRLEEFNGTFRISTSSHLFARLVRNRSYEPEIAHLVDCYLPKDRDVIDVGANIGFFTVKFAKLIPEGRVLAVEPTDNALLLLADNLRRNEVSGRVLIFPGVATDHEGNAQLKFIDGKEEYSSIGVIAHPSVAGENQQSMEVAATTLDALVAKNSFNPGFLKVDVEGAEHLVFKGAEMLLRDYRPVILSEMCDPLLRRNGSSAAEVIQLIHGASYDIYDASDPDAVPGADPYGNIICFPSEMKIDKHAIKSSLLDSGSL